MTKENVRKLRMKSKRLLQLYSLWQETRHGEIQRKYLSVLGEVLSMNPSFNMRQEFTAAF